MIFRGKYFLKMENEIFFIFEKSTCITKQMKTTATTT